MVFDNNLIPLLSKDIIARNDENGMLLFHVHTDEMYFVPYAAYYLFISKCNGSQTLGEILTEIEGGFDTPEGKINADLFIQELLNRNIVTLW